MPDQHLLMWFREARPRIIKLWGGTCFLLPSFNNNNNDEHWWDYQNKSRKIYFPEWFERNLVSFPPLETSNAPQKVFFFHHRGFLSFQFSSFIIWFPLTHLGHDIQLKNWNVKRCRVSEFLLRMRLTWPINTYWCGFVKRGHGSSNCEEGRVSFCHLLTTTTTTNTDETIRIKAEKFIFLNGLKEIWFHFHLLKQVMHHRRFSFFIIEAFCPFSSVLLLSGLRRHSSVTTFN